MLPDDFIWRDYLDGPGLFFGTRLLACASPVATGWRLYLSGGGRPVRYEFLPTEAACRRYAEAWATKWQAEIRRHGAAPSTIP